MKFTKTIMALGFILIAVNIPVLSVLTISEQQTGHLLFMQKVPNRVAVEWIHSVELEPWRETYIIQSDNHFLLYESRFKAFGAGVPDNGGKEFFVEDGWFVMRGFERKFEEIPIQVSCFSNHHVIVNGNYFYLCDKSNDGDFVAIKVEKISLLKGIYYYIQKKGGENE